MVKKICIGLWVLGCLALDMSAQGKLSGLETSQFLLDSLVEVHDIPGLSFAIVFPDEKHGTVVSGYADIEANERLRPDHGLLSGSIGKTYAAALLFQLVDEGKVNLTDNFLSYFPDLPWLLRIPNIEKVTLEMLLQHRTGIPRWVMKPEIWSILHNEPDKIWTYEDRLAFVFDEEPVHEAGAGWAYSDTNYLLIGMLIEKITQQAYYDLVRSRFLEPYHLSQTWPTQERELPFLAMGYSRLPESFKIPPKVIRGGKYVFNPQMEWTGGGMSSTSLDLAKWAKLYYEGQVFSDSLLDKVTTINPNGQGVYGSHSYGMGSFIYDLHGERLYGHSGFMPGYNAIFAYFANKKVAVALMGNCDNLGNQLNLVETLNLLTQAVLGNKRKG